jgi:Leucine-rich repeat (LRR) protein
LRFGKARDEGPEPIDDILEEFPSLRSLPDLPNVTKISIHRYRIGELSRFSLDGAEKFSKLTELYFHNVKQVDDLGALANLTALQKLRLGGLLLKDLTVLGTHPSVKSLTLRCNLESLEGLENFPSLEVLQIQSTEDVSRLFDYAKGRGCRIAFNGSTGDNDSFWWVRFEFHPKN